MESFNGPKNISKELIHQCSVRINFGPGDAMVSKLDMVRATMELLLYWLEWLPAIFSNFWLNPTLSICELLINFLFSWEINPVNFTMQLIRN